MITSNVIHRTFRIKYGESYGTCFTIDVDGKQYIVTAAHVVEGISGNSTIEIFFEKRWQAHNVVVVGSGPADVDVAVLAPSWRLSPEHALPPASDGITFGQDVYFLGFPYNMFTLDFSHLIRIGWCRSPPLRSETGHLGTATYPAIRSRRRSFWQPERANR